ncbi:helix-turn-helix transcriptional regulator [Actinoplanes sp. TBRC 11911]|uniref:helix-turn-helix domain-containing protein n=1 Tax=Actinoplanes sp. TBRC 11911 TaxID=2729386 RepID=UPI00145F1E5A|nr:helix-turn-helix transcriptional regulator [Actinoplanes sp. TBRC 11911]NMO52356.1 helix-turn-helix transcriptional regulator [Actinoplanes sp. TBRC 11911]
MTLPPGRVREQLGDFLRRRREALSPEEAGIIVRDRRRTPGLRRDEVAERANVSVIYYQRLERGRGPVPSPATLGGIARALQLTADESDYLYGLVGQKAPAVPEPRGFVDPSLLATMNAVYPTVAAAITDDLCTVLAQNAMNAELFGPMAGVEGPGANIIWRWFTEPGWRDRLEPREQHEATTKFYVADLRPAVVRRGGDRQVFEFVDALRAVSEEFNALWDEHDVATLFCPRKVIDHPAVGRLELDCSLVLSPLSSQRLLLAHPVPGTPSADRLDRLHELIGARGIPTV